VVHWVELLHTAHPTEQGSQALVVELSVYLLSHLVQKSVDVHAVQKGLQVPQVEGLFGSGKKPFSQLTQVTFVPSLQLSQREPQAWQAPELAK